MTLLSNSFLLFMSYLMHVYRYTIYYINLHYFTLTFGRQGPSKGSTGLSCEDPNTGMPMQGHLWIWLRDCWLCMESFRTIYPPGWWNDLKCHGSSWGFWLANYYFRPEQNITHHSVVDATPLFNMWFVQMWKILIIYVHTSVIQCIYVCLITRFPWLAARVCRTARVLDLGVCCGHFDELWYMGSKAPR